VAHHPARDWAPKWSADGKTIVFLSKRTGSEGLWALSIKDGQAQGEPVLIMEGLPSSVTPLGISDAGIYYYSISSRLSDLYTAEMDLETGLLISQPVKVKTGLEKLCYKPLWTPDGNTLLYISHRLDSFQPWLGGTDIVMHDIETNQERIVHVEEFFLHPDILWYYPTLTSDGRALVGHREPHIADEEFIKIDLENGDVEVLKAQGPDLMEEMAYWPRLSEDGRTLYYLTGDTKAIVRYDIISKNETEIFRSDSAIYYIAFSPDLKEMVFRYWFHNPNELWWLSLEDGEPELLCALDSDERIRFPVWTPDGKYVLFPTLKSEKLYRVRLDGEQDLLECELDMKNRKYTQVHPDGKRIAFMQLRGNYQEVWAMENYLPKSETIKEK
jgi:Tol biopolymer transport system component